jgi:hypothetical protein
MPAPACTSLGHTRRKSRPCQIQRPRGPVQKSGRWQGEIFAKDARSSSWQSLRRIRLRQLLDHHAGGSRHSLKFATYNIQRAIGPRFIQGVAYQARPFMLRYAHFRQDADPQAGGDHIAHGLKIRHLDSELRELSLPPSGSAPLFGHLARTLRIPSRAVWVGRAAIGRSPCYSCRGRSRRL